MNVTTAISGINYALRGTDDDPPTSGDEFNYWLSVLNRKKDELYRDTTVNWPENYDVDSLTGTVAISAAPQFDLADTFICPSGELAHSGIYVIDTDGKRHDLDLIEARDRSTKQQVFIGGSNPQKLYFTQPIVAGDELIGGTIYVSGHYMPADFTTGTNELPFIDPQWAVMATAAEIAYNDITYEDRAEGLNAKANNLYQQMVMSIHRTSAMGAKKVRTSVKRIQGYGR